MHCRYSFESEIELQFVVYHVTSRHMFKPNSKLSVKLKLKVMQWKNRKCSITKSRCGLMDKAPASGAGDCGFESRHRFIT
ncbi:hypothetical protein T4A_7202 [Trichinella pseudospiralis]|uniref:Uncharacterized protein n=1 Tax=Trichinella pseudospiralis TaxID=6337 RepID=A0A0V1G2J3_TRIPS|nr:hypothetical protein T4A_7202 [Trichinella pseudospiralis]KRY92322.1 hypothetical protein T4D_6452 [Trichinella pseudospiralis]KRZ46420.1 hypothetical protein T4C_1427 [Trichinella pseudospiralis]